MIRGYFRRRRERKAAFQAEVEGLLGLYGQFAYSAALAALRQPQNRERRKFWFAVRRRIAEHDGRRIGLDASDRWTDDFGSPTGSKPPKPPEDAAS